MLGTDVVETLLAKLVGLLHVHQVEVTAIYKIMRDKKYRKI